MDKYTHTWTTQSQMYYTCSEELTGEGFDTDLMKIDTELIYLTKFTNFFSRKGYNVLFKNCFIFKQAEARQWGHLYVAVSEQQEGLLQEVPLWATAYWVPFGPEFTWSLQRRG